LVGGKLAWEGGHHCALFTAYNPLCHKGKTQLNNYFPAKTIKNIVATNLGEETATTAYSFEVKT